MVHVKICGVTTTGDAVGAVRLGASSIGLNFVPSSPRVITAARAREIASAVHAESAKVVVVGVVADLDAATLRALVRDAALDCLQLHGDEAPEALAELLPHAYKAIRISTRADVERARTFPGDHILVDAWAEGALGGTGATFDWSLVSGLASERKLTLAGGLRPENVAGAIAEVKPFCVDVASGVERSPGVKDLDAVAAFIAAVRSASP